MPDAIAPPSCPRPAVQCELKHGRVAMLASVGTLVQESFHPFL
jgi:Chlorophyll A-B binding protein